MQDIERKTLLYRSGVEYADFCLNHKEFYNSSAQVVIKFCKKNKVAYHIKEGTQR